MPLPTFHDLLQLLKEIVGVVKQSQRAKVELSLGVLSYNDLQITAPGNALFLVHQVAKEVLATTNVFNGVQNLGAGLKL